VHSDSTRLHLEAASTEIRSPHARLCTANDKSRGILKANAVPNGEAIFLACRCCNLALASERARRYRSSRDAIRPIFGHQLRNRGWKSARSTLYSFRRNVRIATRYENSALCDSMTSHRHRQIDGGRPRRVRIARASPMGNYAKCTRAHTCRDHRGSRAVV